MKEFGEYLTKDPDTGFPKFDMQRLFEDIIAELNGLHAKADHPAVMQCWKCEGLGYQKSMLEGIEHQCDICTNCAGNGVVRIR
jgi:DnaJ-class molecular chaperone